MATTRSAWPVAKMKKLASWEGATNHLDVPNSSEGGTVDCGESITRSAQRGEREDNE